MNETGIFQVASAPGTPVNTQNLFEVRSNGTEVFSVGQQAKMGGVQVNYFKSVKAAGTAYTLTITSAGVTFGTTSPIVTLDKSGTYRIEARVKLQLTGATFSQVRTVTLKLRRTNNTAADLADSVTTVTAPVVTTNTSTLEVLTLPDAIYPTNNINDVIQLFADISALPSAGSITITEASIFAQRLY